MIPLPSLPQLSILALSLFSHASFASPRVVGLDFQKREVAATDSPNRLLRRAKSFPATLYNAQGNLLYLVNATVGTPPQQFSLQLDTGSSDIWIPWLGSTTCQTRSRRCVNGAFDDTKSNTFKELAPDAFMISYVDQTKIAGDYINETFGIGGAKLTSMTMGLAKQSSEQDTTSAFQGIVGVGFDTGEALFSQTGATYPNIISQLQMQGLISTKAYSLWLNDRESSTGSILFGGIDYSKFHGDLTVLPLQQDPEGGVSSFTVVLDNFVVIGNAGKQQYSANLTIPVILDSGTTLTYLPDKIAADIMTGVGAVSNANYGVVVPCELGTSPATFNFQFGDKNGPTIVAEISQFVLPFPTNIPTPKFKNGKTACRWGILPSDGNPNLFGDTFLRSAYVVYNIDGDQVGIAQTNFNVTSQDIREITATSSLPGATSTASGVAAQQTYSGAIFLTAGGGSPASASATEAGSGATGTFDLGVSTAKPSKGAKGAGSSLQPPSKSITAAVAGGLAVLCAMLGGSMMIFI